MKKIFCTALILSFQILMYAQKALPIQVMSYLNRIPALENIAKSFGSCTLDSNNNGFVSVKDAGPVINGINDDMTKYMTDVTNAAMSNSYNNASVPSQDQINQVMQNASQMKGMSPDQIRQTNQNNQHQTTTPSAGTISLMKEVGAGQNAAGQLTILTNEIATKAVKLAGAYDQKMKAVGDLKNDCKDFKVNGADLALPKCDCIRGVYSSYYQKRIAVEDEYLQNLNELIQSYLPKIKAQIGIIDKVESDLNYGDAITIPIVQTQLNGLQRQAMTGIIPILSMVSQRSVESAKEYANIVNTNNGHVPTPCQ